MGKKKNKKIKKAATSPVNEKASASTGAKISARTKKIIAIVVAVLVVAILTPIIWVSAVRADQCKFAYERDVTGRDIKYAEISIKDYGKIVVLLDATTAPVTVENFVKLANEGFYDGLTLHRIIKDFMIQGGDPKGNGTGGSDKEIKGEFAENGHTNDISHLRGVISMARSDDPNSASSQFFICNADATDSLDGKYAAFGYVVKGLSVVDKITSEVFPKTAYASYHNDYSIDPQYGTYKHYVWSYYGNGTVTNSADKPVIEYVKILDSYN